MFLYHLKIKKGALVTIPVKETCSAAMYIMQGKIKVLNRESITGELVNFAIGGNQLVFTAA